MSLKEQKIQKITWIDIVNPTKKEVEELAEKYDFHELDIEAILEENQRARVDTYENYIFMVMHFPKYDNKAKRYLINEFNIFISKDYFITIRWYPSKHLDKIFDYYEKHPKEEWVNTWYILYDILDALLDKIFKLIDSSNWDLRRIEKSLFTWWNKKQTINEIMIKKRNTIALKHMLEPQIQVLKLLELRMNNLFKDDEVEIYFENLIDKVEKTSSEIHVMQENTESIEDTLKSLFDLQTNTSVRYLTIFSAFLMPLTLVTWFFWMNLSTWVFSTTFVYSLFWIVTTLMIIWFIFLIKNNKL